MHITLVRHGQTVENANKTVQGQLNGTLDSTGEKQAKEVALILSKEKFDYIYCSDLGRCKQTATEIIKFHKETPIIYVKELREMNFGDFQGKPSQIQKWDELPGTFETRRAPNGESGVELQERAVNFVNLLYVKHPSDRLLLVTHGGVMKSLKANIEKLDYEATIISVLANCEVWKYEISEPIKLKA